LAPILKIKNVTSQVAYDAKYSDQMKAFGNEHMVLSSTGNIFSASIVKLGIGSLPQRILKLYSDEIPELLDEKGLCNYLKFYPAGASF
jgi:hypothetical protein